MRSWIGRASSLAAQVMIVQLGTTSPRGALPRVQSPAKQSVLASGGEQHVVGMAARGQL